ncbi:MAG: HNH endonuclease [candidate division Zixibacteria bacterium]|nr:HNH endonuclease [candidate division Zixibacteria bacterium]
MIMVFNVYCRTPFGKLHKSNRSIIDIAQQLERTPDAVAMKLVNFASLDPVQQARGIKGLANVSRMDREVWSEFSRDWERAVFESQEALQNLTVSSNHSTVEAVAATPPYETEGVAVTRVRLVQGFFREAVLASYDYRCAICRLDFPELLNAGHIVPWNKDPKRRADPANGIAMCTLHDRAFDRGLFTIDNSHCVVLSKRIKRTSDSLLHRVGFLQIDGQPVANPSRFQPDPEALQFHREFIFVR